MHLFSPVTNISNVTPAQSRALDRQKQTMAERDEKLVSIRLNGKTRARIDWLAKSYGSRQKVLEAHFGED